MGDDAKFLKKHIKTGNIDVHPTERALIVNYELEATILGELGDPMAGESKECQKIIRLKEFTENTDVAALAKEIVDRCKLIPHSKIPEVEQLLFYLQKRRDNTPHEAVNGHFSNGRGLKTDFSDIGSDVGGVRASINKLEEYTDLLYEDTAEKVRGTAMILQLARNPDNMEELMHNETLLGALARVLREDWKKDLELATNIVYTFFCFSTFTPFHSMISHFKVGALSMQIIEYELKRYELWKEDLRGKTGVTDPFNARLSTKEQERNLKKFKLLSRKQEQLLREASTRFIAVSLYLLLNLAEDVKTEVKMVNRGIVGMLVKILERKDNQELLVLTLTFLKKLSIFAENKDAMAEAGVMEKVSGLLPASPDVLSAMIPFLFNLSFDTALRQKMVSAGLLKHLVPMIGSSSGGTALISLLYHLSMDDDCKAMFTYTEAIPLAMGVLLERETVPNEHLAFLINLALCKRNAQLLAGQDGDGLRLIFERAFEKKDPLLLKLCRNIAEHEGPTKSMFVWEKGFGKMKIQEYVGDVAEAVKSKQSGGGKVSDWSLESLRVLGCLNLSELDWARLLKEYSLIPWLKNGLSSSEPSSVSLWVKSASAEDEVLLEVVVLLGTVAQDANGAKILFEEDFISLLVSLLSAKQEDDEIVLQILFVFYQTMLHEPLRKKLLSDTQVPAYLIDLMHDKNPEIRKMCDNSLDVIAENGEEWAKRIQEEKFRWHNAQWLEMLSEKGHSFEHEGGDDELDPVDSSDRSYIFGDMYTAAEDILENYDSDRPFSRLDHNRSEESESEDEVPVHPLRGVNR